MTKRLAYLDREGIEPLLETGLDDACLRRIESHLRRILPEDFRDVLLRMNGINFRHPLNYCFCFPLRQLWEDEHRSMPGVYPPYVWPPSGEVYKDFVGIPVCVYGVGNGPFTLGSPTYGFEKQMPPTLIAIGITTSNNVICIGCGGDFGWQVFHWNTLMGSPGFTQQDALSGLSFVATSFTEFMESLVLVREELIIT